MYATRTSHIYRVNVKKHPKTLHAYYENITHILCEHRKYNKEHYLYTT